MAKDKTKATAKTKKFTGFKLNMYSTLVMFALIPMIVAVAVLLIINLNKSSSEIGGLSNNSMLSTVQSIGAGVDNYFATSEETVRSFATAPIVKECLMNPDDPEIQAKAQQYTVDYFSQLDGWEGIYIATWETEVKTHPVDAVVGRVMREGDALKFLQDSMLAAGDILDLGIIVSPASGQNIISMYCPVYDGDTPIGYVGAGSFVQGIAQKYSDVSALGLDSAYLYIVDNEGTMLYHPDESKIGNPVENEVVKGLVEAIQAGQHPEPDSV